MNRTGITSVLALLLFISTAHPDALDRGTLRYQSPAMVNLSDIAWGNDVFVAVGVAGTNSISEVSSNGINWVTHQSGPDASSLAVGNGTFVAASSAGPTTSNDGIIWA